MKLPNKIQVSTATIKCSYELYNKHIVNMALNLFEKESLPTIVTEFIYDYDNLALKECLCFIIRSELHDDKFPYNYNAQKVR